MCYIEIVVLVLFGFLLFYIRRRRRQNGGRYLPSYLKAISFSKSSESTLNKIGFGMTFIDSEVLRFFSNDELVVVFRCGGDSNKYLVVAKKRRKKKLFILNQTNNENYEVGEEEKNVPFKELQVYSKKIMLS